MSGANRIRGLVAVVLVAIPLPGASAVAQRGAAPPPRPRLQDTPYGRRPGEGLLSFALAGDAVITQRWSSTGASSAAGRAIELLRGADVAFADVQTLFHNYEPAPAAETGRLRTYLRADPSVVADLASAGLDVVSLANDHAGDFGPDGMRLTRKHLEASGVLTVGTGEDLREAREARFLERHNGRVGIVAATATFPAHATAAPPRSGVRGRPGLNPLRVSGLGPQLLDSAHVEALRNTLRTMGQEVTPAGQPLAAFGVQLAAGDATSRRGTVNATDLAEMAAVVRNAAGLSDYVLASLHAADAGTFVQTFARAMIDSGAAMVVGHGTHRLGGIEIYKGKPIFYSLGDLVFQDESVARLPADAFARYGLGATATVTDFYTERRGHQLSSGRAVIATPVFEGGSLRSIELHPIRLGGPADPPAARGRPLVVAGDEGRGIIDEVTRRSTGYGTTITWDAARSVGVVAVPR